MIDLAKATKTLTSGDTLMMIRVGQPVWKEEIRRTDLILLCSIYTLSRRQFYSSLCWELPGYGSKRGLLYSAERYLRFHLQAQRRMATIPFNMLVEKHF